MSMRKATWKKTISMAACAVLAMGCMTGCGAKSKDANTGKDSSVSSTEEKASTSESTEKKEDRKQESDTKPAAEPVNLKIWHDNDPAIMSVIESNVNEALKADNISVTFEQKSGLSDQLKLYGNDAQNGPDLYFYAHDSIGSFAEMGILAPITDLIDETTLTDFLPMTVTAGLYNGKQYQLPVYFETLLFMYNKDLWQGDIPSTTEDLYQYMVEHTDTAAGTYAVVNQHSTAYNVAPIIYGYKASIVDETGTPGLNTQAMKDAVTYNQKFAALQADGDYNTVTTLFNEGKAAAIVGGPWLVSGIKAAGINFGIKSLSEFTLPNGNALAPYSGVQGFCVLKHAADSKKEAISKVLGVIAGEKIGVELANQFNCAPANIHSYDDATVSENEMIVAMKVTADTAVPMPNVPEMGVLWGPAEGMLAAVNKSGEAVDKAAEEYQKQAETAIADMK